MDPKLVHKIKLKGFFKVRELETLLNKVNTFEERARLIILNILTNRKLLYDTRATIVRVDS